MDRRKAVKLLGGGIAGITLAPYLSFLSSCDTPEANLKISLAQWSLHRTFFGDEIFSHGWDAFVKAITSGEIPKGKQDPVDFASIARNTYQLDAIEYVNTFYFNKAKDKNYLNDLKKRADDNGVKSVLIMCDLEGALGDPDTQLRKQAVENHYKWVEAAKFLGCHSIRVNAASSGSYEEQQKLAIDGLSRLTEFGAQHQINIIVENHGGFSSNGKWLSKVIETVNNPYCGTLPDFGNFEIKPGEHYHKYEGVKELLPFAKGVSAKSKVFDKEGNEKDTDFGRMIELVKESGYHGYLGIEYEGDDLSEYQGIIATKKLIERYI